MENLLTTEIIQVGKKKIQLNDHTIAPNYT